MGNDPVSSLIGSIKAAGEPIPISKKKRHTSNKENYFVDAEVSKYLFILTGILTE